jgi:superfamily I DNA/RNA helicase
MLERIDMDEAIPHHEESRSTFDPSMEVVFLERDQLKGGVAAAVAPIVANEIALLLESDAQIEDRPVEPGDIAVLCRSNNQALAVTDALRELNVPVSLDGGSSVLGTEIASDLRLLPGATRASNVARRSISIRAGHHERRDLVRVGVTVSQLERRLARPRRRALCRRHAS